MRETKSAACAPVVSFICNKHKMTDSISEVRKLFVNLVELFLNGEITGSIFEQRYLDLWRKYRDCEEHLRINNMSDNAIDRIFTSLDCYCADASLRDDGELDDEGLYREVQVIFNDME